MKLAQKTNLAILSFSVAAMFAVSGGSAWAHTTIQSPVTAGTTTYNNVVISHGCNNNTSYPNIVAESVIVPTQGPYVTSALNTGQTGTIATPPASVSDALATTNAGTTPLSSLAGLFQLVQSKDVFKNQIERNTVLTSGGSTVGWISTGGSLGFHLHGLIPFRVNAFGFNSATCATAVKINLAVADICKATWDPANNATATNLWLDNTQVSFYGYSIENNAASATVTFNRDLVNNPLPPNCAGYGGADPLYTITIKPSQADVDLLVFPGWSPGGDPNANPGYYY
jgi:hypothetical protein